MNTIKRAVLGAAVAGVVAGAGSALGAAVAQADPTEAPSGSGATSSESTGRPDAQSRGRSRGSSAAAARAESSLPVGEPETSAGRETSNSRVSAEPTIDRGNSDNDSTATPRSAALPDKPVEAEASLAPEGPAPVAARPMDSPAPAAASPSAPVPPPVAETAFAPAATVTVSPAIIAAPDLAPAAPAPVPLPLPLLPDRPALPVAPAGAVTVSATTGTNARYRAASALAQAELLADPPVNHVLLIGTDGTNLSKILEYAYDDPASGFRIAMQEGITGAGTMVGHTTISGPSWSTILTGAWDNKTGVINNLFNPAPYIKWPTAINLIEYYKPAVKTAVVADWQYINDMAAAGGYPADVNEFVAFTNTWEDTDDVVADKTIALIQAASATDSTFIFSYQVAVDEEGHDYGGGSTQYRDAVINTSENIAQILATVADWETANPGEEWTVIITTDHGHQLEKGTGHGFQSPNETTTFVIFDREGDDADDGKQNLGYSNADITPTIVSLFGIAQRSDFDGAPLQTKTAGVVSPANLKQALSDAVSSYGYPSPEVDRALSTRTIFASVPYLIDGFVTDITDLLQSVIDQDIFLISGIAEVTKWIVEFNGDLLVGVTQALARVVATLTGSGTIPPSDPPLPAPPAGSELPWVLEATATLA